MSWVLGVTIFNWGIALLALLKRSGLVIKLALFFAFTTLLLIGPIAVQNGLMTWMTLTSPVAWTATIAVMLWIIPVAALGFKRPRLMQVTVLMWYGVFLGLALVSAAEICGLGYVYATLLFFWPILVVVIAAVRGIHEKYQRQNIQPHENIDAPE